MNNQGLNMHMGGGGPMGNFPQQQGFNNMVPMANNFNMGSNYNNMMGGGFNSGPGQFPLHFFYLISERERIFQYTPPSDNTPLQAKKSQKSLENQNGSASKGCFWRDIYVRLAQGLIDRLGPAVRWQPLQATLDHFNLNHWPTLTSLVPFTLSQVNKQANNLRYILDLWH